MNRFVVVMDHHQASRRDDGGHVSGGVICDLVWCLGKA
jgi:hypothetical protein